MILVCSNTVIMNSRTSFPPPVSRDRVITQYPKAYSPQASLQLKTDWSSQTKVSSQDRAARNQPWDRQKMSKAVVVGDQGVGKTCLINRFCKDVFHRDYKATIGVDFEIERFEVAGIPFSLQIWDTAGQEKFKCIASAYYRGAQVIITVFDMADIRSLDHTRQWLSEAMRENQPESCLVFLVGAKSDLLVSGQLTELLPYSHPSSPPVTWASCCSILCWQSMEERQRTEQDATKMAAEMQGEFWAVSAKS
ncbi:hypothetical protein CRUP_030593, partial [Coryphaenoides rupestris]